MLSCTLRRLTFSQRVFVAACSVNGSPPTRHLAAQKLPGSMTDHLSGKRYKGVSRHSGEEMDLWDLYNEVVYPPRDSRLRASILEAETADSNDRSDALTATDPTVLPSRQSSAEVTSQSGTEKEILLPRPAEITHRKMRILYSQKKLLMLALMIRGLSVDDAFKQLGFRVEKGARVLEQVLSEAVELAVTEHDVEFSTRLWIETIYVTRGDATPRIHRDVRGRMHLLPYHFANVHMRLREGEPPRFYHANQVPNTWTPTTGCPTNGRPGWGSGNDLLLREVARLRALRITNAL